MCEASARVVPRPPGDRDDLVEQLRFHRLSHCAPSQSPVNVPGLAGPPSCGSFPDDQLAVLTVCGVTAPVLDALGEEMGLEFFAPQLDISENDPEFFGAAAFGNKCIAMIRFSGEGVIVDEVLQQFYYGVVLKRDPAEFGYQRFVLDDPAPPVEIATVLQAYESECA